MLSKLYGYLAAAGGLLLVVLAALGIAKRSGRKEEQQVQKDRAFEQGKESSEIDTKVRGMSGDDLATRLRRDSRN